MTGYSPVELRRQGMADAVVMIVRAGTLGVTVEDLARPLKLTQREVREAIGRLRDRERRQAGRVRRAPLVLVDADPSLACSYSGCTRTFGSQRALAIHKAAHRRNERRPA